MQDEGKRSLSRVRLEHAKECLMAAETLLNSGSYKSSANCSYYAVFHAMRAVLAFDEIDMKRHSGIIAEFRRLYIKNGVFDSSLSGIIANLFDVRTDSDYDDFFVLTKAEVQDQLAKASRFLSEIEQYLEEK